MEFREQITHDLLQIGAIQIRTDNYFTWTSGIKAPIYCDNRLTMSYPEIRKRIVKAFIHKMESLQWEPDVVAGCATAGIPHAAWLAEALNVPMVYVRSTPKGHGKENQIEGKIESGQKVVVIEDLISTGGSSIQVAKVLQEAGAEVLGVLAIFSYGLKRAKENFVQEKLKYDTITGYDFLLELLEREKHISEAEKNGLKAWREILE